MKFNKGLDLVNLPQNTGTGSFRYAKNIVLDNTFQYPINEDGFRKLQTVGLTDISISDIAGIISFDKGFIVFAVKSMYVFLTNYTVAPLERLYKTINFTNLTFDINYPVRGTISYNTKNELIIIFSSGVNGNFEDKIINIEEYINNYTLTADDEYLIDLVPNVIFPQITLEETSGALMSGAYQVAIAYKTIDNTYTNFSLLSIPIYIITEERPIGSVSSNGIKINIANHDSHYNDMRLAIIYTTDNASVVRFLDTKVKTEVDIPTLDKLTVSDLDSVTINNSSYINSETLTIKNNILYRGNVKSIYLGNETNNIDKLAQQVANNVILENISSNPVKDISINAKNRDLAQYTKFQEEEYYALYFTILDKKGNIIGSYPIRTTDVTGLSIADHSDGINKLYIIPKDEYTFHGMDYWNMYLENNIKVTLPANYNTILNAIPIVGGWCIHRAIRTFGNSRIINQGLVKQNFANYIQNNTAYIIDYDFFSNPTKQANAGVRYYSFEDLFNKSQNYKNYSLQIMANLHSQSPINNSGWLNVTANYELTPGRQYSPLCVNYYNINHVGSSINSNVYLDYNDVFSLNAGAEYTNVLITDFPVPYLDYNVAAFNKFSESYIMSIANVIRFGADYYADIYNQELALCSTIQSMDIDKVLSYGDTFPCIYQVNTLLDDLVRWNGAEDSNGNFIQSLHTGSWNVDYFDTDPQIRELTTFLDVNYNFTTFNKQVSTRFIVESKYNIKAAILDNNITKESIYEYDNIKDNYSKAFNLQSTQNVVTTYDASIERRTYQYIYSSRIIKSTKTNLESDILNWRRFNVADYYDMPYSKRSIIALHSTYKDLYIQQELCLSKASIKDVISVVDGTTYVGSGELFDRQPEEVIPTPYGYIGCESYFNTTFCDIGLFIIDNKQSKIFHIEDDKISLITDINEEYFINKLKGTNPFTNHGCFITYDANRKRVLLTCNDSNLTLSYYPQIKNWFAFHDYIPTYGIYTRDNTFYLKGTKFYTYTKYNKCLFFEVTVDLVTNTPISQSIISVNINDKPSDNKKFNCVLWDSKFDIDNVEIYDKTYDKLFVHNDSQCTKLVDINVDGEWFDSKSGVIKRELWMFNDVFDYVIDNKLPFITDYITFINTNFNLNKEWFDKSKFIGTFVCITYIFNNWYYTAKGDNKTATPTLTSNKQAEILLKDLYINTIPDNR